ncbi:hypothetical protein [Nocardioides gilvus]|uniref:hypothetical protein n=1 Tax=Nocardioides gilvus TaxID=1735589 RepID=UPI000D749F15|nr:hypothetical protein [Nocardioides gilvus]
MFKKLMLLAGAGVGALLASKSRRELLQRKVKALRAGSAASSPVPGPQGGGTLSTAPGASLSNGSEDHGDSDPMGSTASDSKGPTRP